MQFCKINDCDGRLALFCFCRFLLVLNSSCPLLFTVGALGLCYGSLHKLNQAHCEFKVFGKQLFLCATNKQEYHFSTCMLHVATPQNRHFQVMKPSLCGLCVALSFLSLSFFVSPLFSFAPTIPSSTQHLLLLLNLGGIK